MHSYSLYILQQEYNKQLEGLRYIESSPLEGLELEEAAIKVKKRLNDLHRSINNLVEFNEIKL